MKWRRAEGRGERADVAVDVRERLAPFVEALAWGEDLDASPELVTAPVAVEASGAAGAYRPRHLAT